MSSATPAIEPHIQELLDSQLLQRHGMISIANRKYHPAALLQSTAPHDYQAAAQLIINRFPWIIGEHHDDLRSELKVPLYEFHVAIEDWIARREANLRDYFTDGQLNPEACRKPLTAYLKRRFNPKPVKSNKAAASKHSTPEKAAYA